MLEKATGFQPNVVEGRFMIHVQATWVRPRCLSATTNLFGRRSLTILALEQQSGTRDLYDALVAAIGKRFDN